MWSTDSPWGIWKRIVVLLVKYQRIVHPVLVNRRSKRPCLYYSNAYATFHLFIGDILCKLNPGPDTNQVNHCYSNLTFRLLNARSLRNISASFCDYVQDCKADIFAITETWLTQNDAAVCKEITPNRYRLFHCPPTDRRGGSTALLCRESLNVR